ncbi:MAG: RNA polymerase sigma factor [Planctomycetes bacterium]|jgi:RNA polymerase sigma factor (sigma-70 family)|nr:RNA polymerase sigma factor [Planctomycetota bacterium]MBT4028690.1 RNA polymerase sigma factor [Planctomycetota bacterium]MBT4560096.1 RNA polymerase sigma factor [Planctomycetota bacterium]MBT5102256.1 RNA polymerase sigma factor [Planctomycetota bacterium]MBT5120349.1 RNA polymerase sigma factor [Planctomycetota bacterium]
MAFAQLRTDNLPAFAERLSAFAQELTADGVEGYDNLALAAESLEQATAKDRDQLSTWLMAAYRDTASNEAFTLLYELNHEAITRLIYHHLRRSFYAHAVDVGDVLQEVFFNIYRYPFKFKPERAAAFRNWTHSIVRNTVLKHSRRTHRDRVMPLATAGVEEDDHPVLEPADINGRTPLEETANREAADDLAAAWQLYLHFYLHAYKCLTPREKRALFLVEVEAKPYREASEALDIRVENLKMLIFRARRKIFTIMKRKFSAGQSHVDRATLTGGKI